MCTLVILRRPGNDWPLLLAANRDEMHHRTADPPARHWPDRPEVVAGHDHTGGGSWLGINDQGVVATVMNREGSLGPALGKRSRGELVLEALDHANAKEAVGALADLYPYAYRPFNLVVADATDAYWLRHGGNGDIRVYPIPPGLHMLSATELDDPGYPRIEYYLERFRRAESPEPQHDRWQEWKDLLSSCTYPAEAGPAAAMNLELPNGFGTVSSALIAVPSHPRCPEQPQWLHADAPLGSTPFVPIDLGI